MCVTVHSSLKIHANPYTYYTSTPLGRDNRTSARTGTIHILRHTVKRPKFDILFGENIFFSKIFLGDPPLIFLEVCLKFSSMER